MKVDNSAQIRNRIEELKHEKHAVILAHYYTLPEVQEVADFLGDSLALSVKAQSVDAEIILFAGVHFMAETAKVLCPEKKVLIPCPEAGCSLAESCDAGEFAAFKAKYPGHTVVSYVNTTVGVKALTDICCTSSNALKVVGKKKEDVKIVTSGAGAAAIAIVKLLLSSGFKNVTMCDRKGAIYAGRTENMNWIKTEMAEVTNLSRKAGALADMLVGADVFIGVSAPNTVTTEMVKTMNKDAIVFACANPTPEIFPEDAKAGGAKVISTGRSDYPNQINNVLAFPDIFRGAFDVRASDINEEMKVAAARALAGLISEDELSEDYIIPKAFDHRVGPAVAKAVAEAARRTGVARI